MPRTSFVHVSKNFPINIRPKDFCSEGSLVQKCGSLLIELQQYFLSKGSFSSKTITFWFLEKLPFRANSLLGHYANGIKSFRPEPCNFVTHANNWFCIDLKIVFLVEFFLWESKTLHSNGSIRGQVHACETFQEHRAPSLYRVI